MAGGAGEAGGTWRTFKQFLTVGYSERNRLPFGGNRWMPQVSFYLVVAGFIVLTILTIALPQVSNTAGQSHSTPTTEPPHHACTLHCITLNFSHHNPSTSSFGTCRKDGTRGWTGTLLEAAPSQPVVTQLSCSSTRVI